MSISSFVDANVPTCMDDMAILELVNVSVENSARTCGSIGRNTPRGWDVDARVTRRESGRRGEKRLEEGRGEKQWPRDPITEPQLRYLFDELRYLTTQRDGVTGISPTTIPMVYESPTLISPELKASVRSLAEKLENVPDEEKDWHPGSNQQVLDLVHPSLFCLRIGRSFIHHPLPGHTDQFQLLTTEDYFAQRPDIRHSLTETWQRNGEPFFPFDFAISKAYQWLPTDFAVSEEGRVTSVGYINNLNPAEHPEAYQTISSVLERFIPIFERVASDELSPRPACPFPIDPLACGTTSTGGPSSQRSSPSRLRKQTAASRSASEGGRSK
ncbi:hypothetical protein NUW54_g13319 [Trametes sanguinea]|uniref:Uncharacterized protein n=1 Tax=Trametes sanguinea TaxID=158606 RepID=A0ACC1MP85_9APHY|nr:hypothetical protein NUW54_g13319 [Trametes sanguinea]